MSDPATATATATAPAAQAPDREVLVSLYQKQDTIHARAVHGWFASWRWALVWATQLVFYGLPWLHWNGRQAVLFDLAARRFYIFGLVLYPQDFIYLTGLLVVSACSLFLFTAVAGRLWCGYACPQTVYTEIFMAVERWFEGDRAQRIRLDAAPSGAKKLLRRGGKHIAWALIGLWTGFSFVGYFTPIHALGAAAASLGWGSWECFWVLFYGFATYGNAGWMREQVCKYMCPYARFQSAMFDKDTLIIQYDNQRGEPRGHRGRQADLGRAQLGHCIDCGLCVQVCPTGIDIRNGLQYECIACTACIDVCNGVMDKMHYPRGLIRYDTQNGLQKHLGRAQVIARVLRPRVLIYAGVLTLIVAGLSTSLWLRAPFRVDVVRDRGALSREVEEGWVENVYRLQIMNTTESRQHYRVSATGLPGLQAELQSDLSVGPAEASWVPVALRVPPKTAQSAGAGVHRIEFVIERVADGTGSMESTGGAAEPTCAQAEQSTFIVPR